MHARTCNLLRTFYRLSDDSTSSFVQGGAQWTPLRGMDSSKDGGRRVRAARGREGLTPVYLSPMFFSSLSLLSIGRAGLHPRSPARRAARGGRAYLWSLMFLSLSLPLDRWRSTPSPRRPAHGWLTDARAGDFLRPSPSFNRSRWTPSPRTGASRCTGRC